jgi:hypothetical protein
MFDKYPAGILTITISKYFFFPFSIPSKHLTRCHFFIVEASKLHGKDIMGKNDPYV